MPRRALAGALTAACLAGFLGLPGVATSTSRSQTASGVPPQTTITAGPRGIVAGKRHTFRFSSSRRHSTFRCRLDHRRWQRCRSPQRYRSLGYANHIFKVAARDREGRADRAPARRAFAVARRTKPGLGQFNVRCRFSHRATNDPIVFPAQPGASHSHDFVGNISTDAFTSTNALLASPTTCERPSDQAAYWMPTLLVDDEPVAPHRALIYYRAARKREIEPFPNGLRVVAGDSHATARQSPVVVTWSCQSSGVGSVVGPPTKEQCDQGTKVRKGISARVRFPDCWDGEHLDSADHKSHMAYSVAQGRRLRACPASYPVPLPQIQVVFNYPTYAPVSLSSGPDYTLHADYWSAWGGDALRRLVDSCLLADLDCGSEG